MKTKSLQINKRCVLFFCIVLICLKPEFGHGENKTPKDWKCENKVGGKWLFGVAPMGCDAKVFGEDRYLWDTYLPVIYLENKPVNSERSRYMEELAAVLRESAALYLYKRKPKVSREEVAAFVRAALAMAHQESYWSHYRQHSDRRVKMMRGDSGHGHGIMQVDDRWHFLAVKKGIGWNLVDNIIYSLEEYYAGWEKAPKAKCLTNPNDYRSRARAAYSAYNGGPSKICRWTNPADTWARNDQGFAEKFDKQQWIPYVGDATKRSLVNVECLLDGQESCPLRSPSSSDEPLNEEKVYQNSQKELCVFHDGNLYCIVNPRDLACLQRSVGSVASGITHLNPEAEKSLNKIMVDRHQLCVAQTDFQIARVGKILKTNKNIYLRATPAGSALGTIPTKTVLQVYDFEVRGLDGLRYYKVFWKGQWGYLYSGRLSDYKEWVSETLDLPTNQSIARAGQVIKVVYSSGVNLREGIGGGGLRVLPKGTVIAVQNVIVHSEANEVYYQVEHQGVTGYIYSGHALPTPTFSAWTVVNR